MLFPTPIYQSSIYSGVLFFMCRYSHFSIIVRTLLSFHLSFALPHALVLHLFSPLQHSVYVLLAAVHSNNLLPRDMQFLSEGLTTTPLERKARDGVNVVDW
jgi:hypothetical protein